MVKSILIVEDNQYNLELLLDLFKPLGYKMYSATNGEDALDIIRKKLPDIVLMDIQLPGMDGYEVTRKIKRDSNTKHIPVIAVTGFAFGEDRKNARDAGCDEYMSKPINTREIVKMVEKFIGPSNAL